MDVSTIDKLRASARDVIRKLNRVCDDDDVVDAKKLVEALRNVAGCQEADDGDAALLAVPVDSPDALLDALRVPRQVVVDDRVAELEVQAFGARFG